MHHTEEEMKAKVCWRTMGQPVRENCIGSECAAWAWAKVLETHTSGIDIVRVQYSAEHGGYCSAAGKP